MMRDTGASLTLISTKMWQQIDEPKMKEMASGTQTHDQQKMQDLGAFFSKVLYDKVIGAKRAVLKLTEVSVHSAVIY